MLGPAIFTSINEKRSRALHIIIDLTIRPARSCSMSGRSYTDRARHIPATPHRARDMRTRSGVPAGISTWMPPRSPRPYPRTRRDVPPSSPSAWSCTRPRYRRGSNDFNRRSRQRSWGGPVVTTFYPMSEVMVLDTDSIPCARRRNALRSWGRRMCLRL